MRKLLHWLLCVTGNHDWYMFQDERNQLYRYCSRPECWLGGVTQASVITRDGGSYWE